MGYTASIGTVTRYTASRFNTDKSTKQGETTDRQKKKQNTIIISKASVCVTCVFADQEIIHTVI